MLDETLLEHPPAPRSIDHLQSTETATAAGALLFESHKGAAENAGLRFTTFRKRSTPIIAGRVTAISADATLDEKTQAAYYFVDVQLIEKEMERLGNVELISGMPVEAFLQTEARTPASYVVRPISDFFARAFRD